MIQKKLNKVISKYRDDIDKISSLLEMKEALASIRASILKKSFDIGFLLSNRLSLIKAGAAYPQILMDLRGVRVRPHISVETSLNRDYFHIELFAVDFSKKLQILVRSNEFIEFALNNGYSVWTDNVPFVEREMIVDHIDDHGWTFDVHTTNGFIITIEPYATEVSSLTREIRSGKIKKVKISLRLFDDVETFYIKNEDFYVRGKVLEIRPPRFERNTDILNPETILGEIVKEHLSRRRVYDALETIAKDLIAEEEELQQKVHCCCRELEKKLKSRKNTIPVVTKYGTVFDLVPYPLFKGHIDLWFGVNIEGRVLPLDTKFDFSSLTKVTSKTKCLEFDVKIKEILSISKNGYGDIEMYLLLENDTIVDVVIQGEILKDDIHTLIHESVENWGEVRLTKSQKICNFENDNRFITRCEINNDDLKYLSMRRISVIDEDGKEKFGQDVIIQAFYKSDNDVIIALL